MDAPGSLSYCDIVNHCCIDYVFIIINFMYVLEAVGLAFISLYIADRFHHWCGGNGLGL